MYRRTQILLALACLTILFFVIWKHSYIISDVQTTKALSPSEKIEYTPFSFGKYIKMEIFELTSDGYQNFALENITNNCVDPIPSCPSFTKCNLKPNHVSEMCQGLYANDIFSSNVYVFDDVISDPTSRIWTTSPPFSSFVKPSCSWPDKPTPVQNVTGKLPIAISLQSKYQHIYFHLWTEFIIGLMMIRPYMIANPHVPVLIRAESIEIDLARKIARVDHLPTQFLFVDEPVYVSKLVVPLVPVCWRFDQLGRAFPSELYDTLQTFARTHFSVHELKPSKILIEQRKGKRQFTQFEQFKNYLLSKYPADMIQVIGPDTIPIEESAKHFANAAIYIAPHGSGFTNMIFMKPGTAVIEISPRGWNTDLFYKMSKVFGLDHAKLVGSGGYGTPVSIDKPTYEDLLRISERMINESKFLNF